MMQSDVPSGDESAEKEGGHRILHAEINGVNYVTEMCVCGTRLRHSRKKDKRDPQKWSPEEDELLRAAVKEFGEKRWKDIALRIPGRTHVQCLQRWKKVLKPGLKKGHWTEEEDRLLSAYHQQCANWAEVAEHIPGRTAKQCRERWYNHVDPTIRKGWRRRAGVRRSDWTEEEDMLIVSLQRQWGNRWSSIAEVGARGGCEA